jgi:hypothetical protein
VRAMNALLSLFKESRAMRRVDDAARRTAARQYGGGPGAALRWMRCVQFQDPR